MNTCSTCRFWESTAVQCGTPMMAPPIVKGRPERELGICRRYAPHPHFGNSCSDDWCGEWDGKDIYGRFVQSPGVAKTMEDSGNVKEKP